MEAVEIMDALVYREGSCRRAAVRVIREVLLEVCLDGRRVAAIACTGEHVEDLAVGFLRSEGWIERAGDIDRLETLKEAGTGLEWPGEILSVGVWTTGGTLHPDPAAVGGTIASSGARGAGRWPAGAIPHDTAPAITPAQAFRLVDRLVESCILHERTRGAHGAALAEPERLLAVREDIGRHNALDMLSGHTLLHGIDGSGKILVRTGRTSVEIVSKAVRMGVPILLSLGAPTTEAVRAAIRAGITLAGGVREGSMTVYTHESRIGMTT